MDDSLDLDKALAQLIRENLDLLSARLEKKFVEEYPSAKANSLSADLIHRWTLMELELIAKAIEENDPDIAAHKANFGYVIADEDLGLTQLASSMASALFLARHMAPVIYFLVDVRGADGRGQEMLLLFERVMRDVLAIYCNDYVDSISRPKALMRSWDLLSGLELDIEPEETPTKKHRRVVVAENELASGSVRSVWEGDWLTSREKDVLKQLVAGRTNAEIAAALDIRQNTVKNHVARIFSKFGVSSRAELLVEVLGD